MHDFKADSLINLIAYISINNQTKIFNSWISCTQTSSMHKLQVEREHVGHVIAIGTAGVRPRWMVPKSFDSNKVANVP